MQEKSNNVKHRNSRNGHKWLHSDDIKAILADLGFKFTMDATGKRLYINGEPFTSEVTAATFRSTLRDNGVPVVRGREIALCVAYENWLKEQAEAQAVNQ